MKENIHQISPDVLLWECPKGAREIEIEPSYEEGLMAIFYLYGYGSENDFHIDLPTSPSGWILKKVIGELEWGEIVHYYFEMYKKKHGISPDTRGYDPLNELKKFIQAEYGYDPEQCYLTIRK